MHIIATVRQPSNQLGGIEKTLLDTLRGLHDRGHPVTLIYCREGDQLEAYQTFCEQTIQVHSFRVNSKFLLDALKIPAPPDSIIYCNEYADLFFSFTVAALRQRPLVAHHHLPASTEHTPLSIWKQTVTLAHVDRHIAVSDAVKQDWISVLGINKNLIDIVYNGVDPNLFNPISDPTALIQQLSISKNIKLISYVGRLEEYKGLDCLIKGFHLLLQSGVPAKLLIVGKSTVSGAHYEQHLRDLVYQLGIVEQVTFLGHSLNPQSIYCISDVVVVPSLWLEAFGRVVIEAMACGIPVIASRVGGIPEILTGRFQNYLFEPGNESSLFQTLNQVIDWQDNDPELGNECREHAMQKFNLEQMVNGVEAVLLKTLTARKTQSISKLSSLSQLRSRL